MFDLIINRRAKRYQQDPQLLAEMQKQSRNRCRVWVTESVQELDEVTAEICDLDSEFVAFSGGDGSLMAGVSALYRHGNAQRAIAVLPGGTTGTIARNFGVSGDPVRALRRLTERPLRRRKQASLQILADRAEPRLGFIFGTGLVTRFFRVYYQDGARGLAGAAGLVARIFAGSFVGGELAQQVMQPMRCKVQIDGSALAADAFSLVCCAVVKDLGLGMRLTYRGAEDPQRPHLVVSSEPPRRLGPRMPWVLAGRSIASAGGFDDLFDSLRIDFPEAGAFVLDGDLIAASRVEIQAGPQLNWIETA